MELQTANERKNKMLKLKENPVLYIVLIKINTHKVAIEMAFHDVLKINSFNLFYVFISERCCVHTSATTCKKNSVCDV